MNKKKKVNSSQENKDPQNLPRRITPLVAIGVAVNTEQGKRGSHESLDQCDAFSALTSDSISTIQRRQIAGLPVKRLNYTRREWVSRELCGTNFAHKSLSPCFKSGSNGTTTHHKQWTTNLPQPTLSFRSIASKKTISQQQPVTLMLLYLLSLHVVAHIILGTLFFGSLLSSAQNVSGTLAIDLNPISRAIRAPQLLTDVRGNEILVRTVRHGLFKGYILPQPDRLPQTRASSRVGEINDASVIGFLGIRYASAPIRRLRFMPPTAYYYAPNQVHDMQHFGPICRQRYPFDFGHLSELLRRSDSDRDIGQASSKGNGSPLSRHRPNGSFTSQDSLVKDLLDLAGPSLALSSGLELQLHFMKRMMPKESFSYLKPLFKLLASREESEDCLNLNIYAPIEALTTTTTTSLGLQQQQPVGQLKPVLVIIHGESFDFGAGSTINGHRFVQQTRLITITFNFRLNMLGFPPKLAGASRGNLGLMDQVAALHWIKDNIGSFGGSPSNITLMGTKRGAIFVNLLMLSPLAKGLFQRAIMEDGSALTPIVANHIISPISSNVPPLPLPNPLTATPPSLPAIQHVRFLAKLCDCPVYHRQQHQQQAQPTKFFGPTGNGSSHQFNSTTSGTSNDGQQQQQQLLSSVADEIKANALTFECLRHKPIEQLMQPVPLDLLQFNQANGELSIAARWLRPLAAAATATTILLPLEAGQQVESPASGLAGDQDHQSKAQPPSEDQLAQVDSRIINKLVLVAARQQLEKDLAAKQGGESSGEAARLSDLLGALYAPPTASVRPLFGPIEDGTIVPEEDMAVGMLKNASTFVQRDLLIGLSKPVISSTPINVTPPPPSPSYDKTRVESKPEMDTTSTASGFELGPDHIMADRLTAYTQQVGLTSEQAISLVNLFVRSYYRYHNQEITNSIINHYLSDNRILRARKLSSLRWRTTSRVANNRSSNSDDTTIGAEMNQQQLLVLDSLLEAFQDALTNVPVLKTFLIHAVKQLESLVDAFVGQQFEKWQQSQPASIRTHQAVQFDTQLQAYLNDTSYLFTSFARSLLNDTNWPLQLHSPSNHVIFQQPKATYVYQFDANTLIRRVMRLSNELTNKNSVSFGWKSLKELFDRLIERLHGQEFSRKFGFECIMQLNDDDSDGYATSPEEDAKGRYVFDRFNDWLCSKYSKILKSFISSGNVNHLTGGDQDAEGSDDILVGPLSERVARFDSRCPEPNGDQPQQTTSGGGGGGDHHSVKITEQSSEIHQISNMSGTCRRELNSMVLDHILSEFELPTNDDNSNSRGLDWPVFNIFTQQVATLPGSRGLLHVGPIVDLDWSASQYDQKSTFSARSSFWANYVPALNCTRTQPVIPASLLSSSLANSNTNSSYLLNLKLLFSCQHGGKTSYEAFESLIKFVKQQLQARITQWRLAGLSSGEHNHHSLRMANNGHPSSSEESSLDQQQQDHLNGDFNGTQSPDASGSSPTGGSGSIEANNGDAIRARHTWEMSRTKYVGILVSVCGFIFSITLASGACAIIRRKRKHSRQLQQQAKLATQVGLDDKQISDGQLVNHSEQPLGKVSSSGLPGGDIDDLVADDNDDTGADQQQETVFPAATMNGTGPTMISCQNQSIDYHVHESATPITLMPSQFCTLDNQNGYIYWGDSGAGGQQQDMLMDHNGSIPLCRSHSLLDVVPINGSTILASSSTTNQSPMGHSSCSNQEPIMMPILSGASKSISHHNQSSSSLRRAGCLTNHSTTLINGTGQQLHGDSSSETQDNSKLSISKKRVKISDPLNTTSRLRTSSKTLNEAHVSTTCGRRQGNKATGGSHQVSEFNDPLYCPVHHDQVVAAAAAAAASANGSGGSYHQSWNGGSDLIEPNHHYLNMHLAAGNCNHQFTTDFTGSSQEQTFLANQRPQGYKYAASGHSNYGSNSNGQPMMEDAGYHQQAATAYHHHNHSSSSYQPDHQ